MSGEVTPTIHGYVSEDPQLRNTERGTPAARFTLVSVPREYDRGSHQWRDGEPVNIICTALGRLAQHIAASLAPGVHVIATGHLTLRGDGLHLATTRVGIDLEAHVAYIDATLPAILAGTAPAPAPATSAPPTRPTVAATTRPVRNRGLSDPANWGPLRDEGSRAQEWAAITTPSRT